MNQCPWDSFTPGTKLLCEAPLCSWIVMPGNMLSGVAYLTVAFLIFRMQRLRNESLHWTLCAYGILMMCTGISALLYYASRIFLFQSFDLSSMFFFGSLLVVTELTRLSSAFKRKRFQLLTFVTLGTLPTLLFVLHSKHPGVINFLVLVGSALILQLISIRKKLLIEKKNYLRALYCLFFGVIAIAAEKTSLCNPDNHIFQWHTAWNISAASACFFLYLHLSQNDKSKSFTTLK